MYLESMGWNWAISLRLTNWWRSCKHKITTAIFFTKRHITRHHHYQNRSKIKLVQSEERLSAFHGGDPWLWWLRWGSQSSNGKLIGKGGLLGSEMNGPAWCKLVLHQGELYVEWSNIFPWNIRIIWLFPVGRNKSRNE